MRGLARPVFWKFLRGGLAACAGAMLLLYVALPYVTLYRFDQALRRGDVAWVDRHVDWRLLRDSFAGGATPDEQNAAPPTSARALARLGGKLGDGVFRTGPNSAPTLPPLPPGARLGWAYFNGPASFIAHLTMSSRSGARDVKVVFRFDGVGWRVVRLEAPAELLRGVGPMHRT
jgi:hypothetical protein